MGKRNEPSFTEKVSRGFVDVFCGRFNPTVRLGKWVAGWFSSDKILVLLGNTASGKTEMMHLLSDSQFAPFFWGTQHHAVEKNPGEQESEIQLGCTYFVTNDGPGVESVKSNRMLQVANSLGRYLVKIIGKRSESQMEKINYKVPIYILFTCNIETKPWDMVGLAAELRFFKEKVLGLKYCYVKKNKKAKVKPHVARSDEEDGETIEFAPKFLMVGTHFDKVPQDLRDSYLESFETEISRIMQSEFKGNCIFRTVMADIRSMNGRQNFMKVFEKRMEEFDA